MSKPTFGFNNRKLNKIATEKLTFLMFFISSLQVPDLMNL